MYKETPQSSFSSSLFCCMISHLKKRKIAAKLISPAIAGKEMVVLSPLLHPHLWDGGLRGPRPPVSPHNSIFLIQLPHQFVMFSLSLFTYKFQLSTQMPIFLTHIFHQFPNLFTFISIVHVFTFTFHFNFFMCSLSLSLPIVHVFTFTFHINHSFVHFHFSFPNLLISLFPRLLKFIFCREVSLPFCLFDLWLVWLAVWMVGFIT